MKTFKIKKETKCTVWHREFINIEAETEEEAIKIVTEEDYEAWDSGYMYETSTDVDVSDNDGFSTIEVKIEDKIVYENGKTN